MKVTGTGQFNRKVELFNGDEVYRENNINGVSPFNSPSPKDNIPAYGPKVQLRDEKMSDNASVKTITKGATVNHGLNYDKTFK